MPVKKQEAHRALELLEDYHSRLSSPQDRALRSAIERVIRIFKSRLFQALLDIQEFYELTLLDDSKSIQQKTAETLLIASKWEQDNAVKANGANRIKQQEQQQQQQLAIQQQALEQQEEEKPVPTILAETPSPSRYPGTRVSAI
uniref:Disks large 1 tumor suppressor protein n=1 Tax=Culex pipiens TaxID=7175 RepID=A0A8D8AN65_CULPI